MADTIKAKQNGKTRAQLILILMQAYGRPVTAREIMNIVYPGNKNESQISDELRYMFQELIGWDDVMPDNFYYKYNLAREMTGDVPITYYVMEYDCLFGKECG